MAEDFNWYLEAERRGLLKPDEQQWLAEARRRGLAPGGGGGPAAPTLNFDLTQIPASMLSGVMNAPAAAYNMIAGPLSAYKTLEIGSEASQPKTLAEADKFYRNRAVAPRAIGTAEGLVSGAALGIPGRFLPETTNEERLAARELGGTIGGAVTGGLGYKELAKRGFGALSKFIGLPAAMSAAEPLSRLDIPGAVESATTGATIGGAAKLTGSAVSPILERYSPAARALRAQNEALGGGKGVLSEINKQVATSKTPELVPESYTTPASVAEAGETLHNQAFVAGNRARATMGERLQNEVFKLAPEDAMAPNSYIEKFKTLATEGPEALRTTIQRKLGKVAAEASPEEGAQSGWVKKAVQMWEGVDDATLKQIKSVFENTDEGQNPSTFRNLVKLHQELGQIKGNDAITRVVKTAKQAVEHDINELGKTYPDAVKAWRMWNKDYARDVGQYYNKGAPLRELTNESFGRSDIPFSEKIPMLAKMSPEEAMNVMQGIRQGPAGVAAADNVSAGAWQHLLEKHQTTYGTNFKGMVEELSKPQNRRTWEVILGPRFADVMKLKNTLVETGLSNYRATDPRAVSLSENFHTIYGGAQAIGAATGLGGGAFSAIYHLGHAAYMKLKPEIAARVINDRMGLKLLQAGLLEKPGTPKANAIISKLAEVVQRVGPEQPPPGGAAGPISEAEIVGPPALPMPGSGIGKSAASSAEVFKDVLNRGQAEEGAAALRVRLNAEALRAKEGVGRVQAARAAEVDRLARGLPPPTSPAEMSARAIEAELAKQAEFLQSPEQAALLRKQLQSQSGPPEGAVTARRAPILHRALPGSIADAQQVIDLVRQKMSMGEGLAPNEVEALKGLAASNETAQPLRVLAGKLANAYEVRQAGKPIPLSDLIPKQPELPQQAVANVNPVGPSADFELKSSKGKAAPKPTTTPNAGEESPLTVMNKLTKGAKILVNEGEMREMKYTFGRKANEWFSLKGTQSMDDMIDHFAGTYGTDPTYNGFKQFLEDALTKKY